MNSTIPTLKLGEMTNEELAEWFGIKVPSFKNSKNKKLEILKDFCDFVITKRGTVVIKTIYIPVYLKKKDRAYPIAYDNFNKYHKSIDTSRNIANRIIMGENVEGISEESFYCYVLTAKKQRYGKCGDLDPAEDGWSYYAIVKQVGEDEYGMPLYEPLTEEEKEIKDRIIQETYGSKAQIQAIAQVVSQLENKEITEECAGSKCIEILQKKNLASFGAMLDRIAKEIGAKRVVRATIFQKKLQLCDNTFTF